MTSLQHLSKNRGEWAEIVAIFRSFQSARVPTVRSGDNGLLLTGGAVLVSEIRIERNNQFVDFRFNRDDQESGYLSIFVNGSQVAQFSKLEVVQDCEQVCREIQKQAQINKKGNFAVPDADLLIQKYHLGTGKTKSSLKQDLEMILIDPDGIPLPRQGFSIKSFVGADPTIFNTSRSARFKFRLDGAKSVEAFAIANEISNNKPKSWVQALFQRLNAINAFTQTIEIPEPKFERNLELLDAHMPTVLGALLLQAYCSGEMSISECLKRVILSDPLGFGGDAETFYTYRVKHFLRAAALGFSSSKPWDGNEGADGGMLFVNKSWSLSCMLSSRKDFENYLLKSCRFESPSSSISKHGGYGKLTKEWHGTYVDLLLQVRECDPFNKSN